MHLWPAEVRLVTEHAVQHLAEPCPASLFGEHPRAHLPWRIVPDVLVVTTGQLRDPVALIVLMKAGNRLLHDSPRNATAATALMPG
jgi:hypothetical protein